MIFHTDARAAGDEYQIGIVLHGCGDDLRLIAQDTIIGHHTTVTLDEGTQHRAVGVDNLVALRYGASWQ